LRLPGGDLRWISTHASRASDGDLRGLHRLARPLPRSIPLRRALGLLANRTSAPLALAGPQGAVEWINEAMAGLLGQSARQAIGKGFGGLLPVDPSEARSCQDRFERGEPFTLAAWARAGGGGELTVEANPVLDASGRVERFLLFAALTDCPEEIEGSDAFRCLFELSPVPTLVVAVASGRILEANHAAAKAFPRAPLAGADLGQRLGIRSGRLDLAALRFRDPEAPPIEIEALEVGDDPGARSLAKASVRPLPAAPEPAALLVLQPACVEAERLKEQLRRSQRMEAVGLLAGGVAHDFNNLLAGVKGFAELVGRSAGLSEEERGHVRELLRISDRAGHLAQRLLAFSRRKSAPARLVPLNEVAGGLAPMLKRLLKEDIRFETELAPDTGAARVDPAQVEQVIMNLILNAQEASTGEDKTIALRARRSRLTGRESLVSGQSKVGDYATIEVEDRGEGMEPAVRARIFEPFFTTKQGIGTGLGLSIVCGIVKELGGELEVETAPGKGSRFRVHFPRLGEKGETSDPEAPPATAAPARREGAVATILVAEDQPQVRDILQLALADRGYRLLVAEDGREALELARESGSPVDVLVTDAIMPKMHGGELAKRVKELFPASKTVVMSGLPQTETMKNYPASFVDGYLEKPFSMNELVQTLEDILDRREA